MSPGPFCQSKQENRPVLPAPDGFHRFSYQDLPERYIRLDTWIISSPERSGKGRIFYTQHPYNLYEEMM